MSPYIKQKVVYISAPYSQGDPIFNIRQAIAAADKLVEMGYAPYIPHLTVLWDLISPKPYETWMEIDKVFLSKSDVVLRLDGESVGANMEVRYAERLGIPVYYSLDELRDSLI